MLALAPLALLAMSAPSAPGPLQSCPGTECDGAKQTEDELTCSSGWSKYAMHDAQ